jgi:hypothetical protein
MAVALRVMVAVRSDERLRCRAALRQRSAARTAAAIRRVKSGTATAAM